MQSFARFLREASATKPDTLLRLPLDVTRAEEAGYVPALSVFGIEATPEEQRVAQAYVDVLSRYEDAPYEELDPRALIPTQHTLLHDDIEKFRGGATSGIWVLRWKGLLFIIDGHHRAAAAVLDDDIAIIGRVINLDGKEPHEAL